MAKKSVLSHFIFLIQLYRSWIDWAAVESLISEHLQTSLCFRNRTISLLYALQQATRGLKEFFSLNDKNLFLDNEIRPHRSKRDCQGNKFSAGFSWAAWSLHRVLISLVTLKSDSSMTKTLTLALRDWLLRTIEMAPKANRPCWCEVLK